MIKGKSILAGVAMLAASACVGTPSTVPEQAAVVVSGARRRVVDTCKNNPNKLLYGKDLLGLGELLERKAFINLKFPQGVRVTKKILQQEGRTILIIGSSVCEASQGEAQVALGNRDLGVAADRKIFLNIEGVDIQGVVRRLGLNITLDSRDITPVTIIVENMQETSTPLVRAYAGGIIGTEDALDTLNECKEPPRYRTRRVRNGDGQTID